MIVHRHRRSRRMLKQLGSVYRGGPLWPGDTLSHQLAADCFQRGCAKFDKGSRTPAVPE